MLIITINYSLSNSIVVVRLFRLNHSFTETMMNEFMKMENVSSNLGRGGDESSIKASTLKNGEFVTYRYKRCDGVRLYAVAASSACEGTMLFSSKYVSFFSDLVKSPIRDKCDSTLARTRFPGCASLIFRNSACVYSSFAIY